jgi:hypothetical protein
MTIIQVGGRRADSSIIYAHPPTGLVGTDHSMLEDLIGDTPVGGTAMLANGGDTPYAISGAREIRKTMKLHGRGVSADFVRTQPFGTLQPIDQPVSAPWLRGSVILQTLAGADGISCPQSGMTVDLDGIGVKFDEAIKFVDTGHAFCAIPDVTHGSGLDHGLINPRWTNLIAYGTGPGKYDFQLTNLLLGHLEFLRGWGAGILQLEGNSDPDGYNYGNTTITDVYGQLFVGASGGAYSHGFSIKQNRANAMGLLTFVRIQCNANNTTKYPQAPAMDLANQCFFTASDGGFDAAFSLTGGKDFEGINLPVRYGANLRSYVEPGGISGNAANAAANLHRVASDSQSSSYTDSKLVRRGRIAPYPSITSAAANGSTGTATLSNSSDDMRGVISLTPGGTGITNAYNNQAAIWTPGTAADLVTLHLKPANAAAALAGDLYAIFSGGTMLLRFQGNGTGSFVTGTPHQWSYVAVNN